jgi:hypothetical protein
MDPSPLALSKDVRDPRTQRACVSAAPRDQEALDLALSRTFVDAYVVSLAIDMQTRRLTLQVYGALRNDAGIYLATLTFFGASALALENAQSAFPNSVRITALLLTYAADDDEGTAELRGRSAWTFGWQFDGFAYEEHPAVIASLSDDL